MPNRTSSNVLRSKLHPPRAIGGFVRRPRLVERLEASATLPVNLVSAPAGYGKSSLVADWLSTTTHRWVWISLDRSDSELSTFLLYLVSAIRTVEPSACREVAAQRESPDLRVETVTPSLINELDQLDDELMVVLDDYHQVEGEVHRLMSLLLRHPPRRVHWKIVTRFDPPLPLQKLRSRGECAEIRQHDLRFTLSEGEQFFDLAMSEQLSSETVNQIQENTEGWPTGYRFASLVLRDRPDIDGFLTSFEGSFSQPSDYLVSEVLDRLPPRWERHLLQTSILKSFSAELCDAVVDEESDHSPVTPHLSGRDFLEWLEVSDLFVSSLEPARRWFRYHILFGKLLRRRLEASYSAQEIAALRVRAGRWLESHGEFEEAQSHYTSCQDFEAVSRLVAEHRHSLMADEQWTRLAGMFRQIPPAMVEGNLDLLVTRAWLEERRTELQSVFVTLREIRETATELEPEPSLQGEILAFEAMSHYLQAAPERAAVTASESLELMPAHFLSQRGFAQVIETMALQASGSIRAARSAALRRLSENRRTRSTFRTRTLIGLCFAHLADGNLNQAEDAATRLAQLGSEHDLAQSTLFGAYFRSVVLYERGNLLEVERILNDALGAATRNDVANYVHCTFVRAFARAAVGDFRHARSMLSELKRWLLEIGHEELLEAAEACEADLELRSDWGPRGALWARSFEPRTEGPRYRFFTPELTLVKVLLAEKNEESWKQAKALLDDLEQGFEAMNQRRLLISIDTLKARIELRTGQRTSAERYLNKAIKRGYPRELLRTVLDMDSADNEIIDLLRSLPGEASSWYLQATSDAKSNGTQPKGSSSQVNASEAVSSGAAVLLEPLTPRELEVLELLAKRLRDKEIAQQLFLSVATVKRHNTNIFQKLQVRKRLQAVDRAKQLGILA